MARIDEIPLEAKAIKCPECDKPQLQLGDRISIYEHLNEDGSTTCGYDEIWECNECGYNEEYNCTGIIR